MFTHTNVAMISRDVDRLAHAKSERLHRAGYRDGEPRPRVRHHWANLASGRSIVRKLRAR